MNKTLSLKNEGSSAVLQVPSVARIPHAIDWADRLSYAHDTWCLSMRRSEAGEDRFIPDAVVWPRTVAEVADLVTAAVSARVPLVPWGGGSGIVGGALATAGGLIVDFKRMNKLLEIDDVSMTARAQPGIVMQDLEDQLNRRGYTCGHFPQSMHSATLGGAIAHRGAGFKSTLYGKIEDIVLGIDVVLPSGALLHLKGIARNSNGPDLRHLFFGSEGTLGFITEATIRLHPLASEDWSSFRFESFANGLSALRGIMQSGSLPSFVRLFDEEQSAVVFSHLGTDCNGAVLIMSWEEREFSRGLGMRVGAAICPQFGGKYIGDEPAKWWWDRRLSTSGLLRTQHKVNCFADTIEVAAPWSRLGDVHSSMREAMKAATGDSGVVFGHVAHAYPTGADIYMIFHGVANPGCVDDAYDSVVEAAVTAALRCGATLSHHHGIGLQRNRFLPQEYGDAGFRILAGISDLLDPTGTFNPGKLGKK